MADKTKHCTNAACGFNGIRVQTDKENCIGCNRSLQEALQEDLLGDLLDGLFRRKR